MNTKTRVLGVVFAGVAVLSLAVSCASSEEGVFDGKTNNPDSSTSGGSAGSPFGGVGGQSASGGSPGFGGTGGFGTGGTGGFGTGGTGGVSTGGTGGVSTGGTGGVSTGGAGGQTTCNPTFCPAPGVGQPCCITPNGPCGADEGSGCMQVQDI